MTLAIVDSTDMALLESQLVARLAPFKRIAVAFSGGVDSAVVARLACLAQPYSSWAILAVSPSLAEGELEAARFTASQIGINFISLPTNEFNNPDYLKNSTNRCFFCKSELYASLKILQNELQFDVILNGTNADDIGDHRPGMQAAVDYQVQSPLLDAGISKSQVRKLAQFWGLQVWDKPASPCLASRIAYGIEVTIPGLKRIDQAERFLKQTLNLNVLRVRDLGHNQARIEVPPPALPSLLNQEIRASVNTYFKQLGFISIMLDLEGYRSGSLNQLETI